MLQDYWPSLAGELRGWKIRLKPKTSNKTPQKRPAGLTDLRSADLILVLQSEVKQQNQPRTNQNLNQNLVSTQVWRSPVLPEKVERRCEQRRAEGPEMSVIS